MMEKIKDYILEWRHPSHSFYSRCQIQICEHPDRKGSSREGAGRVIIITQLPGANTGMSVTNGIEIIVNLLLLQHGILFYQAYWIEHYIRPEGEADTWDHVRFHVTNPRPSGPHWERVHWKRIAQTLGNKDLIWKEL